MAGHGGISVAVLALVLTCAAVAFPGRAEAWGTDGHRATCLLAERLLEPATLEAVRSLLPEYAHGSLASLCLWPDEIKQTPGYRWTVPLHYIDTPAHLCGYDYERDCYDEHGNKGYCASGGINNFTAQLTKFHQLQHGQIMSRPLLRASHETNCDIHQPLHVGSTSDAGGNTIIVEWYTQKVRLHHIWDDDMIVRAKGMYYNNNLLSMVDAIMQNITKNWVDQGQLWSDCSNQKIACPDTYATESATLACQYAYKDVLPGSTLADEYFLSRLPIVEARLAQGGVRLAAILNRLFGAKTTSHLI